MLVQKQPNRWSCLPTSFAAILGIEVEGFIRHLGHDGSEILWPMLKEPACRRGFHIQECIDVMDRCDYSVTPFEAIPQHVPAFTVPAIPILFGGSEEAAMEHFRKIIYRTTGVITGISLNGHAVAYDQGVICDPNGHVYQYSLRACESRGFIGTCAWSIQKCTTMN